MERNLTQEHLGFETETNGSSISKIERGIIESPRLNTIMKIAKALKVDYTELIKE